MAEEIFDESHYFVCSGGLKPARFKSGQDIMLKEDGNYYLTEYSLKCKGIDFSCKWTALLFAIIAAAMALLASNPAGWVLLAAIGGAVVGAGVGFAICGSQAAVIRTWVVIKEDAQIGEYRMVSNHKPVHLTCKLFSNTITFKPNVTNEFEALCLFGGNILMTGLEGFMYVYAFRGGGLLIKSPMTFLRNFGANYLKTLSVNGFIGRSVFGIYGGANAYYMSDTKGFDAGQVVKASAQSFFFAETAAYHAVTERDPQSIALLLSMGGIPGGRGLRNLKDATNLDIKIEAKNTLKGWKNPVETIKNDIKLQKQIAKEFKNELISKIKKGLGAHEKAKVISIKGKTAKEHAYEEMQNILDKVKKEELSKRQIPESLEAAVNKKTGEIIIGKNKTLNRGNPKPELHTKTQEMFKEGGKEVWNERNCSEADVTEQIHRKGQNVEDYEFHAVERDPVTGEIRDKHTCRNCDVNMKEAIDREDVTSNHADSKMRRNKESSKKYPNYKKDED